MIISNDKFTIFFGNKNNCPVSHKVSEFKIFCADLSNKLNVKKLIFQKQIHGSLGKFIDSAEQAKYIEPFDLSGDFLITNQKGLGIGVLTADCLPIIFYETKNHVTACIHAGWRSSLADICANTLKTMFSKFKFLPEDLHVFFGPCARACCYEVGPNFLENLKDFKFKSQVIRKNGSKLFFDNVLFNKLILLDLGLFSKNMNFEQCHCTMCSENFHSYRKNGANALRQISFVLLK